MLLARMQSSHMRKCQASCIITFDSDFSHAGVDTTSQDVDFILLELLGSCPSTVFDNPSHMTRPLAHAAAVKHMLTVI